MENFTYHSNTYFIEYGMSPPSADNRAIIDRSLAVNCAGKVSTHISHISKNSRLDYFLFVLISGKMELYNGNERIQISTGDVVVFPPNQKYQYKFYGEETKSFLWVHFSGFDALNKMNEYGIELFPAINKTAIENHISIRFQKLFEAFTKNDRFRDNDLSALLDRLLIEIGRAKDNLTMQKTHLIKSTSHINKFYTTQIKITELAKMEGMCMTTYNLRFKEEFGVSPTKYILALRMLLAKELLIESDISITEIGAMCGYLDINFFSKVFKKEFGISPTAYRKNKTK